MSEIKSQAPVRPTFDRRSVVKGAAWSVPVIAAAIAAPAAAASTPPTLTPPTMTLSGEGASRKLKSKILTAPTGFDIHNTSGTTGPLGESVAVTVTLTRTAGTAELFVASINNASGGIPGSYKTNSVTGTYTAKVTAPTVLQSFTLEYSHTATGTGSGDYDMHITVNLPNGELVSVSSSQKLKLT